MDGKEFTYYKTTDLMIKIYSPIFILFGTTGNVLSAFIWHKLLKDTKVGVFLVALSVTDLVGLLLEPLLRGVHHWFEVDLRQNKDICKTLYILDSIAGYCTAWFLFAFCFERAGRLMHIQTSNSKRFSVIFILLVIVISFSLCSHRLTIETDMIPETNISIFQTTSSLVCGVETNPSYKPDSNFNFYWVQLLLYGLIPSTFIIGCSMAIGQMLCIHKRGNMNLLLTGGIPVTKGDNELAKTALFLGIMHIICTVPVSVFKTQTDVIQTDTEELTYVLTAGLAHVEYTFKFIIYCVFNKRFRDFLAVLFRTGTLLRRLSTKKLKFRKRGKRSLKIDIKIELVEFPKDRHENFPEELKEIDFSSDALSPCSEPLSSSLSVSGSETFKFESQQCELDKNLQSC
ncbi:MAG: 7 transmembrane receptor [Candidatus Thiodiazotropha sp.]